MHLKLFNYNLMSKFLYLNLFIFCLSISAQAQVNRDWVFNLTDPLFINGNANCVVHDNHSNAFVGGLLHSNNISWPALLKLNSSGQLLIKDTISPGTSGQGVTGLAYDNQEMIYASGDLAGLQPTMFVSKYDTSGNLRWQQRFYTSDSTEIVSKKIKFNSDGFIYAMGIFSDSLFHFHMQILKLDTSGNVLHRFADSSNFISCYPVDFVQELNGDLYCLTQSMIAGSGSIDVCILAFDQNGQLKWTRCFDGPSHAYDVASDIHLDTQNNMIVSGYLPNSVPRNNCMLLKLDSLGNTLWYNTYSLSGSYKFRTDEDNFIYMVGSDSSALVYSNGLSKFDSSGNLLFTQNYIFSGYSDVDIQAITIDDSANVYFTGTGYSLNSLYDIITCKVDSSLNLIWSDAFNPGNAHGEVPNDMTLTSDEVVYVAGFSDYDQIPNTANLSLIKYSPHFLNDVNEMQSRPGLGIFPNPVESNFTIQTVSEYQFPEVNLYDSKGMMVFSSVIGAHGKHRVPITGVNLSSGLYMVRVKENGKMESGKIIVH